VPAPDVLARTAAECHDLTVRHATAAGIVDALTDVSLTVAPHRLTVVAGPSGSGKSTLLRVLAGLQPPSEGRVLVDGADLDAIGARGRRRLRRRSIGIVLQNPGDNLVEYLSAIEQVRLAAQLRGSDRAEAERLLAAVGLSDRADRHPAELSGGEQQRTAFAAAVVGQPTLLLADEPTAQLDSRAAHDLVAAVRALVEQGCTALLASHDQTVIEAADDVVWLRDGRRVSA
jgi:ABC-type lipoprotein export system ATPase subunit